MDISIPAGDSFFWLSFWRKILESRQTTWFCSILSSLVFAFAPARKWEIMRNPHLHLPRCANEKSWLKRICHCWCKNWSPVMTNPRLQEGIGSISFAKTIVLPFANLCSKPLQSWAQDTTRDLTYWGVLRGIASTSQEAGWSGLKQKQLVTTHPFQPHATPAATLKSWLCSGSMASWRGSSLTEAICCAAGLAYLETFPYIFTCAYIYIYIVVDIQGYTYINGYIHNTHTYI